MARFTVSLPESLREYVEAQVAARGLKTAADYVSFVVCMDQVRKAVPSFEDELLEKLQLEPAPVSDATVQRIKRDTYERRVDELRRELEMGFADPDQGDGVTYGAESARQLLDEIKALGRTTLAGRRSGVKP